MQQQGMQPPVPLDEQGLWAEQPQHGSSAPTGRPQAPAGRPSGPADRPLSPDSMDSTAQFARPHFDEEPARPIPPQPMPPRPSAPQPVGPQSYAPPQQPQQPPQQQAPSQPVALPAPDAASHPLTRALPPAEAGAGSSPIFEAMESNWFRSGRADRMRAVQVTAPAETAGPEQAAPPQAPAPQRPSQNRFQRPGTSAPQPPVQQGPGSVQPPQQSQAPRPSETWQRPGTSAPAADAPFGSPQPQRGFGEGMPAGASATGQWRTSANDEVWRRAEQVREPSAGGVLPSGLPRRVPQANLVPGTAESAPAEGPQVSRSPEEVRGRLTNLRRGIQQGRQAGTATPNQGSGPYGNNPQER
jgi:hypothetical protein